MTSGFINDLVGAEVFCKCENQRRALAFEARGASNAVFGLGAAQFPRLVLKARLKELIWHFARAHVSNILTAGEDEIVEAVQQVIEPSSAVPLAVILKNRALFAGKRVGVVVTGGNVDPDRLPWMQGRA